uniref:Secreted protein n=1 Tax=Pyxicephalus adspersus TaxID=30357 RepID=A0AAV3AHR1_PYXAD|nr:TPA: hypothetical protein GDO54_011457 [Pyxicephalus adspersus]
MWKMSFIIITAVITFKLGAHISGMELFHFLVSKRVPLKGSITPCWYLICKEKACHTFCFLMDHSDGYGLSVEIKRSLVSSKLF